MPEGATTTPRPNPGAPGEAEPTTQVGVTTDPVPPGRSADPWSAVWRRWRPSAVIGLSIWLCALAIYAAVTAVSWLTYESVEVRAGQPVPAPPNSLAEALATWHQWDTVWYLIIADSGYEWDSRSTAFFPLYPMLVRAANVVLPGGTLEAGLIISALSCLVALVVLHRLANEVLGGAGANRAGYYLMAFPTGFFLMAAYNESLFLALAAGSLYAMRNGRWWWAGLLGGYASATRMVGVVLVAAFLYEYLRQRGWSWRDIRWNVLAAALVPVGLVLYSLYLWETFGDPMHFLKSQEAWFRTGYQTPWTTVGQVMQLISGTEPLFGPVNIRNIINLSTALGFLGLLTLALVGPWRLGRENAYMVIFAAAIILMPLSNPLRSDYPLSSMWRFALECIPAFLVLAKMGRNPHFDRLYLAVALSVQGAMIVTFVHSNFVA